MFDKVSIEEVYPTDYEEVMKELHSDTFDLDGYFEATMIKQEQKRQELITKITNEIVSLTKSKANNEKPLETTVKNLKNAFSELHSIYDMTTSSAVEHVEQLVKFICR
jgi:DnaJ-domain-containing protein 1